MLFRSVQMWRNHVFSLFILNISALSNWIKLIFVERYVSRRALDMIQVWLNFVLLSQFYNWNICPWRNHSKWTSSLSVVRRSKKFSSTINVIHNLLNLYFNQLSRSDQIFLLIIFYFKRNKKKKISLNLGDF